MKKTNAIKISATRQYIDGIDACIYLEADGTITYQDMLGYRTYKTLRGLNSHLKREAEMHNRELVTVTA